MAKYHINPETGRPNICNPIKTGVCKYATDGKNPTHYENKEEARAAYETEASEKYGATKTLAKSKIVSPQGELVLKTKRYQSRIMNQEDANKNTEKLCKEFEYIEENAPDKEVATLFQYSMALSIEINRILHKEPIKYEELVLNEEQMQEKISELDNVIEKFETRGEQRTLYRYLRVPEGHLTEDYIKYIVDTGEYSDSGYMSTTEDLAFIVGYAHKHKKDNFIILEIETDRGISLQRDSFEDVGSIQSFEKERLLPRDMSFTIKDYGKTTLNIDESRDTVRQQFAGSYSEDWRTGKRVGRKIPKRTFPIITLRDNGATD